MLAHLKRMFEGKKARNSRVGLGAFRYHQNSYYAKPFNRHFDVRLLQELAAIEPDTVERMLHDFYKGSRYAYLMMLERYKNDPAKCYNIRIIMSQLRTFYREKLKLLEKIRAKNAEIQSQKDSKE